MLLSELLQTIERLFPSRFAMPGDAIGVQVEGEAETNRILVCLEVDDAVIDEALAHRCDTIITFHPLIYSPLTSITRSNRVGTLVQRLIRSSISLISVHTAYDAFPQGTNAILAEKLGLHIVGPLQPTSDSGFGMGLVARTQSPMPIDEFVSVVRNVCGGPVKYVEPTSGVVNTVAIVAGSGMSFFDAAVASSADTFLTADVKYHGFHAARNVIGLVDPGHYEMEQFVPAGLSAILRQHVADSVIIHTSSVVTNPIRYAYPNEEIFSSQPSGTV